MGRPFQNFRIYVKNSNKCTVTWKITSIKFDKCFTFVTGKDVTYNQFLRVQELNSTRTHELTFSHISNKDLSLEDSLIIYFSEYCYKWLLFYDSYLTKLKHEHVEKLP